MRNLKKSLSIVLALALLVSSVFVGGLTATAAEAELYTTINTYDDESDITLESVYNDTLQAPIILANDSWIYESFGSYGTSVVQDPLGDDADNVVKFGHIKSKTNSWPGAVRIYKQGTESAKTTFEPFAPKTNTTYESNQYYFTKYLNEHIGKNVTVYCSFTDSADWHDKIFKGKVTGAGDDYLIVDEASLNKEVLILSVYIHFVEFDK